MVGLTGNSKIWIKRQQAFVTAFIKYLAGPKTLRDAQAPVIIGGTGGSGTRVLVQLLSRIGYFAGANLHRSLDSLDFDRFCEHHLERYLSTESDLRPQALASLSVHVRNALIWHRATMRTAGSPWLVKHPRSLLCLPLLNEQCPNMRFIHLVRDGRDMAFSANTQQADRYSDLIIPRIGLEDQHERLIRFWAVTNLSAKTYGEDVLGERYRLVKFEDLCMDPVAESLRLFSWLGCVEADLSETLIAVLESSVITLALLGRWKSLPLDTLAIATTSGRVALETCRY